MLSNKQISEIQKAHESLKTKGLHLSYEVIEQLLAEVERLKPRPVVCNKPCLGASEADHYVGMHMSNEECPACRHTLLGAIGKLEAEVRAKDAALAIAVEALEEIANTDTSKVFSFRLTDIAVTALRQIQPSITKIGR